MMPEFGSFAIRPIGRVESQLNESHDAPHQDHEGAPSAWLVISEEFSEGLEDIQPGQEILVLTWFHLAERDVLRVHPQNNQENPLKGVFSTRSLARPNPIGLHKVKVVEIKAGNRVKVDHLDALNGTPIIDLKPSLKA
jgi:tRNA-Thr(GGU) m(6)t(6)A37 methyltransferase TsaA